MGQSLLSRTALILLSTTLSVVGVACSIKDQQTITTSSDRSSSPPGNVAQSVEPANAVVPTANTNKPQSSNEENTGFQPSVFELALDKAAGALSISQSAQSVDDWQLVANQYQDAIALMNRVGKDSPFFDSAQTKIREYKNQIQNVQFKIQQSTTKPVIAANTPGKAAVIIPPQSQSKPANPGTPPRVNSNLPPETSIPIPVPAPNTALAAAEGVQRPQKVFTAPIKRRIGGTPIIQVNFNGDRQFEMILDTGASGTVITQKMASALGVVPVGKAKANTASAKGVEFPIGYVKSIEVAGARVDRVAVAIAGSELETGLLGHDFFGNYDITIKRNLVEFRPHRETSTNFGESGLAVPVFPKPNHYGESP